MTFDERYPFPGVGGRVRGLSGIGGFPDLATALETKGRVIDIYRQWRSADVIIITLGLVEAWYDRKLDTYLNHSPYGLFISQPTRFELRITNFTENREAVFGLLTYLKAARPDLRAVLTVSPVALSDTFSGQDVVVANTYSKAVLRAVAQDVAAGFNWVDYFPSYEMAVLGDPALVWQPDHRHVKRAYVEHIMRQFIGHYLEPATGAVEPAGPALD